MIAISTFVVLLVCLIVFIVKLDKQGIKIPDLIEKLWKPFRQLRNENQTGTPFYKIRSILLYVSLILFFIMLVSSFIPTAFSGEHLTGLFLIIHATFAPLFALSLALVLLLYSYGLKITSTDFKNIQNLKDSQNDIKHTVVKFLFWLIAIISIPLLLSIILILYPIMGTELQNFNIIIHRICALLFSGLLLVLLYNLLLLKKV